MKPSILNSIQKEEKAFFLKGYNLGVKNGKAIAQDAKEYNSVALDHLYGPSANLELDYNNYSNLKEEQKRELEGYMLGFFVTLLEVFFCDGEAQEKLLIGKSNFKNRWDELVYAANKLNRLFVENNLQTHREFIANRLNTKLTNIEKKRRRYPHQAKDRLRPLIGIFIFS
jgi:hypothetical protein